MQWLNKNNKWRGKMESSDESFIRDSKKHSKKGNIPHQCLCFFSRWMMSSIASWQSYAANMATVGVHPGAALVIVRLTSVAPETALLSRMILLLPTAWPDDPVTVAACTARLNPRIHWPYSSNSKQNTKHWMVQITHGMTLKLNFLKSNITNNPKQCVSSWISSTPTKKILYSKPVRISVLFVLQQLHNQ